MKYLELHWLFGLFYIWYPAGYPVLLAGYPVLLAGYPVSGQPDIR